MFADEPKWKLLSDAFYNPKDFPDLKIKKFEVQKLVYAMITKIGDFFCKNLTRWFATENENHQPSLADNNFRHRRLDIVRCLFRLSSLYQQRLFRQIYIVSTNTFPMADLRDYLDVFDSADLQISAAFSARKGKITNLYPRTFFFSLTDFAVRARSLYHCLAAITRVLTIWNHYLEFLRDYLEIEQTRFQDRLTVDFDVEKETLDAQVPNLILQPLVENAIRHGIAPRAEAGLIQIQAKRANGFVEPSIRDNGAGLTESGIQTNGIGLKNTQERLEKLYGEDQKFEITSGTDGGFQVKIKIPYHDNEQ